MEQRPAPARVLGGIDATCVVIGAIIGVGIFFTPTSVAKLAATPDAGVILLPWIIAGAIALAGALAFAHLGRRWNGPGAQYQILRDVFGPCPAFLFVFCNATAVQAGAIGIIAVICTNNLWIAAGKDAPTDYRLIVSSLILITGVTATNILGVRWGSRLQNFTVFAKVATLLLVGLLAATWTGQPAPLTADAAKAALTPADKSILAGVLAGLVPALFSYGGWQHALWISGEVKDPSRILPRAIIGGVTIVIAVYLLANASYLRLLGPQGVAASSAVAADAVAAVWPDLGKRIIAGAVGLSALGVLNAQLLSGPRLIQSMAADARFFKPFARISPSLGTPIAAILLMATTAIALLIAAGADGVDRLLTGVVFIDTIFFVLTGAAVFAHRASADRSTITSVAAALFVLGELGVLVGAYLDEKTRAAAWIGLAWIGVAAVLYFARFSRASAPGRSNAG